MIESAEKTILGAIMLDNGLYYEAASTLQAEDFSLDSFQRIFRRMTDLAEQGRAIDTVTLCQELNSHKEIESVGGWAMIAGLTEGIPRRPAIRDYIRIVKDKALGRKLMAISEEAIQRASDQTETALETVARVVEMLEGASAQIKSPGKEIRDLLPDAAARFEMEANKPQLGILGASLMTDSIEKLTSGIVEGELCLLAARPGQGKTEAAIQCVVRNARRGMRVYLQSLEMQRDQILRRMWRWMAKIPVAAMRDPRCLRPDQRQAIRNAQEEVCDLPIFIDDTHELTIAEFRSRAVLASRRWKADLLVVDYGQLLLVPRSKSIIEAAPKQAETLRHIARDYCRTLALVQLRRTPPNDLNRYPDIEDILGSSAWEQAAQIILMLHRTRKDKKYTGEDYCFLGKMREMQQIEPFGIAAEKWGEFVDRYDGEVQQPDWRERAYV